MIERKIAVHKQIACTHDLLRVLHKELAFYLECRDIKKAEVIESEISQARGRLVEFEAEVCL